MKKLLAFVLVLAVASMANAAMLELSVDGVVGGPMNVTEITLVTGATVQIGVDSPGTLPDEFWIAIVSGPGEWLGGLGTLTAAAPAAMALAAYPYAGVDWIQASTPASSTEAGVGMWWSNTFHCTGEGLVEIQLMDASGYELIDTILITQEIPEPVTMTLLGLGGLALIRRRRA